MIARLDANHDDFAGALQRLRTIPEDGEGDVRAIVADILEKVKSGGDQAVIELTNKLDNQSARDMQALTIGKDRLKKAYESLDPLVRDALDDAATRVENYHQRQLQAVGGGNWEYQDDLGNTLGQRVRGMNRAGIYTPGGKAAYPSTVIMTAIPARVAGVSEIVLCVPTPNGEVNDLLLAAAHRCEVDQVFAVGGAQAIAAMTYGTETIRAVDKIVGPGNIYVATAKEMVFGKVGIDMIAGPSEVVIVADDSANVDWVIQDMFAQAEHDELAQAIVVSDSEELLDAVEARLPAKLRSENRKDIIGRSLADRGALILVEKLETAFEIVNELAPEHLQLAVENPMTYLPRVKNAGAVFLGSDTAEVVGDYSAGPSHVLPTSSTARFSSPLGVYDFLTRTSIVNCSAEGAIKLNRTAAILAVEEGLTAHAESARARVKG